MTTIHLNTLDLHLEAPDTTHYIDIQNVENVEETRIKLAIKYGIEPEISDNEALGETSTIETEKNNFNIYTYYSYQARADVKAHEETHVALTLLAITKNKKIARQIKSKLETLSGIDCFKETRHIRNKDFREEVIACLSELIYAQKTEEVSDDYQNPNYEEMQEARVIYTLSNLKKRYEKLLLNSAPNH